MRYLDVTYNGGKLPDGLSNLRNLQYLIVRLHQSVEFSGAPSYLPVEIWNMKELRHLQFMGSDLPDPCGAVLPNLLTLSDVSSYSCTKEVFRGIPNLKKLGIRIVLTHRDGAESYRPFDHLAQLEKPESLNCVVVNPCFESQVIALPGPKSNYHLRLKKLTLSGCGFRWEDLNNISALAYLEVLKLRCHGVWGSMWDVKDMLSSVKFLLLEDIDLVQWRTYFYSFGIIRHLSIRHCYKLEEFPDRFGDISSLKLIELV